LIIGLFLTIQVFWKFNAQLLHDKEYVDQINSLIEKLETELVKTEDKRLKWDYIKCEIRGLTFVYSFKKNKTKHQLFETLNAKLIKLQEKLTETPEDNILAEY
jgi:hypothetical protein